MKSVCLPSPAEDPLSYKPKPIDTSAAALNEEILKLTELLAKNAHDIWARQRLAEGWRYGPIRDDAEKQHPCLVPYEDLPESEKQYDRNAAMETLKAILALGYRIESSTPSPAALPGQNAALPGEDLHDQQRVGRILDQLNEPGSQALDLLKVSQAEEHDKLWRQDARLYRAFGKKLIDASYPAKAFELIREGLSHHDRDWDLKYLRALALARGGNVSKAAEYLDELLKNQDLDRRLKVEALSLTGRLAKDRYERCNKSTLKTHLANESAKLYEGAHALSSASFPGINAATMSLLAGKQKKARQLAAIVIDQAKAELTQPGMEDDYWLLATLGEASIILRDSAEAASWYRKAVQYAGGHIGNIATMRRQVLLLGQKVEVGEEILGLFNIGSVVVFSGHMIDHPTRQIRRFPPDPELERKVGDAIKNHIEDLKATIGYCSAACGSDILFAEEMLRGRKELHIVLPFDKNDFYYTSVDFGLPEMTSWRKRCDAVMDRATEVHYATRENFLGDEALFEFVNTFSQGLAITRALELAAQPYALAVLDRSSKKLTGGTAYFLEKWTRKGRKARLIDLAALRSAIAPGPLPRPGKITPPETAPAVGKLRREVKAMLFADVKNFSKLREDQAPSFFAGFLDEVARIIQALKKKPAFCNTWGDGLYLVFDSVIACADFAMRLLERIEKVKWAKVGLPEDTTVRMGIHAGPVYPRRDKIIGRNNFFGSHVNRAARIEPVTTPGCAFTTEQFAATLAAESGHDFICEYVGVEELAKGYDRVPLYRLGRRLGTVPHAWETEGR